MSLKEYHRKRRFDETPEPRGADDGDGVRLDGSGDLRFVVQKHAATRLHYDLRLEMGGVYRSWAVPKGPSLNPTDQRMAVRVEDHPIEYGQFEGIIPKGNYGAGTVMIWDAGTIREKTATSKEESEERLLKTYEEGNMKFVLDGFKLAGEYALVKTKPGDPNDKGWLLLKKRDPEAAYLDILLEDRSVATGRTLTEIAAQAEVNGEMWLPGKGPFDAATLKTVLQVKKRQAKARRGAKPKPLAPPPEAKATTAEDAPAEKFPRNLKPMIATHADAAPPSEGEWLFEPRLDGVRALAAVEKGRVHLYSRQGLSFDAKFKEIGAALRSPGKDLLIDGEVCPKDGNNKQLFVYDVLHCGGKNLRVLPLSVRKRLLQSLTIFNDKIVYVADAPEPDQGTGLARHGASLYQPGTSSYWLKLKAEGEGDTPRAVLTSLEKVFWKDEGYTKGDLIAYYRTVAPVILPYLKDRPESLNRHPNGIDGESFFHKDMTGYLPRWIETVRVAHAHSERSIDYLVCQNEATLLYMANLGCIELNPWLSRVGNLEHPDHVVIDLDPDAQTYEQVVAIALCVKEELDRAGVIGYPKTSGATGMHIYLPLDGKCDYEQGRALAEGLCRRVEARMGDITTTERNPAKRRGKLYLDYMQNRRSQTLAAPYCVRPRPGATVSAPLAWDEVKTGLSPRQFTIMTMPERIAKRGDVWEGMLDAANDVEACLSRLV